MSETPIRTIMGDTNTRTASSKCYCYVAPAKGTIGAGRSETTLARHSMNGTGVRQLNRSESLSVQGYDKAAGGSMTEANHLVPEGTILKVFATVRQTGGVSFTANLFLRVRANAPLIRVTVRQTRASDVTHAGGLVEGRFDVLTAEQVDTLRCFDERFGHMHRKKATVDHLFEVEEIAPAKTEAKAVKTRDGGEVVVETVRRRRQFRL